MLTDRPGRSRFVGVRACEVSRAREVRLLQVEGRLDVARLRRAGFEVSWRRDFFCPQTGAVVGREYEVVWWFERAVSS